MKASEAKKRSESIGITMIMADIYCEIADTSGKGEFIIEHYVVKARHNEVVNELKTQGYKVVEVPPESCLGSLYVKLKISWR